MTPEAADDEPSPSWSTRLLSALGQVAVLLFALAAFGRLRAPDLPDVAPDLRLLDPSGQPVALSDLRGQTVLLNFWATWCLPCRVELPALKAWSALHPEVTVVAVSLDRDHEALRRALPGLAMPWRVVIDDGSAARDWGVTTVPTSILVGPDGSLRGAHTGIALGPELEAMLRGL